MELKLVYKAKKGRDTALTKLLCRRMLEKRVDRATTSIPPAQRKPDHTRS